MSITNDGPPVVVEPLKSGDFKLPLKTLKAIRRLEASLTVEMVQKLVSMHSLAQLFPIWREEAPPVSIIEAATSKTYNSPKLPVGLDNRYRTCMGVVRTIYYVLNVLLHVTSI